MKNKQKITLNENQLKSVIKESIKKVLNEKYHGYIYDPEDYCENDYIDDYFESTGQPHPVTIDQDFRNDSQANARAYAFDGRVNKIDDFGKLKFKYKRGPEYEVDTYPADEVEKDRIYPSDQSWKKNADRNYKRMMKSADKRPLHRKGSMNRELTDIDKTIKESIKRVLKENWDNEENIATYDEWSNYLNGTEPLFEFEDGIIYVDYDENSGCLCSGHVTNVGFHKDGEVEVPVYDGDFQSALEEVCSRLSCNHEEI